ncbi:LicD family protein [Kitasatospora sp. NPDC056138]|uniref:LicD family protein n=1 Tax=Kitasatospora sp. NPDC056138 TaxID=3345724 RepID=UPI0035DE9025
MGHQDMRTAQPVIDSLYRTYAILDEVLREHEIPYFMTGGTLLGAIRHGGVIPWDDDGDLGVSEADFPRVRQEVLPVLARRGIFSSFGRMGNLKIFSGDGRRLRSEGNIGRPRYPIVDIFPWRSFEDRAAFSSPACRERWSAQWFPAADLDGLVDHPFGPIRLPAPPEAACRVYLARTYGEDWQRRAEVGYDHVTSQKIKPVSFEIVDPAPALPSAGYLDVGIEAGDTGADGTGTNDRTDVRLAYRTEADSWGTLDVATDTAIAVHRLALSGAGGEGAISAAEWRERVHRVRRRLLPPQSLLTPVEISVGAVADAVLPRRSAVEVAGAYVQNVAEFIRRGNSPTHWFNFNDIPLVPVGAEELSALRDQATHVATLALGVTAEVCSLFLDALDLYDAAAGEAAGFGRILAWRLRKRLGMDTPEISDEGLSAFESAVLREERELLHGGGADSGDGVDLPDRPVSVAVDSRQAIRQSYAAEDGHEAVEPVALAASLGCDEAQLRLWRLLAAQGRVDAAEYWLHESVRSGNPNAMHEWTRRFDPKFDVDYDRKLAVGARSGDVTARVLLEGHLRKGDLVLYQGGFDGVPAR